MVGSLLCCWSNCELYLVKMSNFTSQVQVHPVVILTCDPLAASNANISHISIQFYITFNRKCSWKHRNINSIEYANISLLKENFLESIVIYEKAPGSNELQYIVGFGMVEMAISTNPKPTIYRNLYENTGPGLYITVQKMENLTFWA